MKKLILAILILGVSSCIKQNPIYYKTIYVNNYYMPRSEKNLHVEYYLAYNIDISFDTIKINNYNASDTMIITYRGKDYTYVTDTKIYDLYKIKNYQINSNDNQWFINIIGK